MSSGASHKQSHLMIFGITFAGEALSKMNVIG